MVRLYRVHPCDLASVLLPVLLVGMMTLPVPALSQGFSDPSGAGIRLDYHVSHSEIRPDVEVQLLDLLNRARRAHRLAPVAMDGSLRLAARAHSQDMARRGYFGHGSLADRLAPIVRRGLVGENIIIASTAEAANREFWASFAHRTTMLDYRFHRVGIGIATAGELGMMITEDFAE